MRRVIILAMVLLFVLGCKGGTTSSEDDAITGNAVVDVEEELAEPVKRASKKPGSCEDSDGGVERDKAGKVMGISDSEEYTLYDKCIAGILLEYYCEQDKSQNQNLRCPEGTKCLGGACRLI